MNTTALQLYRQGYDNIHIDQELSHEHALDKSRIEVTKHGQFHALDVIYINTAMDEVEFEYNTEASNPEYFTLKPGERHTTDWFDVELFHICPKRFSCTLRLYATLDVDFKRMDALQGKPEPQ